MAVPPRERRLCRPARSVSWSVPSGVITNAEALNAIRPTDALGGSVSISVLAAFTAASSRVGCTSVACIEPDTSITSITFDRSPGTLIVAWGRAKLNARPVRASRNSAVGRWRRMPGARGTTWPSSSRLVKRTV